jgi:hypothetical protein
MQDDGRRDDYTTHFYPAVRRHYGRKGKVVGLVEMEQLARLVGIPEAAIGHRFYPEESVRKLEQLLGPYGEAIFKAMQYARDGRIKAK